MRTRLWSPRERERGIKSDFASAYLFEIRLRFRANPSPPFPLGKWAWTRPLLQVGNTTKSKALKSRPTRLQSSIHYWSLSSSQSEGNCSTKTKWPLSSWRSSSSAFSSFIFFLNFLKNFLGEKIWLKDDELLTSKIDQWEARTLKFQVLVRVLS